jgi:two-component system sensor histidine kinase QseC
MKLFTRYNRINVAATILIFIMGSIAFYFVLHYILIKQLDETLYSEQQEIREYIETHNKLPDIENTKQQWITVEPTNFPDPKRKVISYERYSTAEKEWESVRQLSFCFLVNNQYYTITVNRSEVEMEDILKLIIWVTTGMIAFILLLNFFINRTIISKLWQPFYNSINQIKHYKINEKQSLILPGSSIDEFNILNESLNSMASSIANDYHAMKTFTENASHEMQTPLAVIRSKTDILLQQTELNEETVHHILDVEEGIQKLTRLNQALLLLSKIENTQFDFTEKVDFEKLIQQKIEEKKELLHAKQISMVLNMQPVVLLFHQQLGEILVNNLLNNAIKYTPAGEKIIITLDAEKLTFINSSDGKALDVNKIFQRFYKTHQNQEGIGLGLAIVSEIVKIAGYNISYYFSEQQQHVFSIKLNK